ncbi:MAG: hypothetical protein ISS54_04745 [Dehalococcoidia bacterium]|nr:hypothetical protein [Dehalococcoidia bacterium]
MKKVLQILLILVILSGGFGGAPIARAQPIAAYLAIDNVQYPPQAEPGQTFDVIVTIVYESMVTDVLVGIKDRDTGQWLSSTEGHVSTGTEEQTAYTFELTAPSSAQTWHLRAESYVRSPYVTDPPEDWRPGIGGDGWYREFDVEVIGRPSALAISVGLETDRSVYHPGDRIRIYGDVSDNQGGRVSGATVSISLKSPSGMTHTLTTPVTTGSDGRYETSFSNTTEAGRWTITATASKSGASAQSQPIYVTVAEGAQDGGREECLSFLATSSTTIPADGKSTVTMSLTVYCPGEIDFRLDPDIGDFLQLPRVINEDEPMPVVYIAPTAAQARGYTGVTVGVTFFNPHIGEQTKTIHVTLAEDVHVGVPDECEVGRLTNGDFSQGLEGWTIGWKGYHGGNPYSYGSHHPTVEQGYLDLGVYGGYYNACQEVAVSCLDLEFSFRLKAESWATYNSLPSQQWPPNEIGTDEAGKVSVWLVLCDTQGNSIGSLEYYYSPNFTYEATDTSYPQKLGTGSPPPTGWKTIRVNVGEVVQQHLRIDASKVAKVRVCAGVYGTHEDKIYTVGYFDDFSLTGADAGLPPPPPPPTPPPPTPPPPPAPTLTPTEMTLIAEDRIVPPGATVQVPIRLENAQNIGSLGFNLSYDPAVAQVTKVLKGSLPPAFTYNDREPGIIRFGFATTEGISGVKGSAAYVEFKAVGAEGSRSPLTLSEPLATDTSGATLSVELVHGELTIRQRQRGDCDGDGRITVLDALCPLKMYVKLMAEDLILDMDGDGRVTPEDARRILEMARPGGGEPGDEGPGDEGERPWIDEATHAKILSIQSEGESYFNQQRGQVGTEEALLATIRWFRAQDIIKDAGLSADKSTIWLTYENGLLGGILTYWMEEGSQPSASSEINGSHALLWHASSRPSGTHALLSHAHLTKVALPLSQEVTEGLALASLSGLALPSFSQAPRLQVGNARATILLPFHNQGGKHRIHHHVPEQIGDGLDKAGFSVDYYRDQECTVDIFKKLNQYGVIYIYTHGGTREMPVFFATGETPTIEKTREYGMDIQMGFVGIVSGNYVIYPKFFQYYGGFPKSLFYASGCNTLMNTSMANALTGGGVGTYVGWTGYMQQGWPLTNTDKPFFEYWAGQGKPVEEALAMNPSSDYRQSAAWARLGHIHSGILQYTGEGGLTAGRPQVEPLDIETNQLPDATLGQDYRFKVDAKGGKAPVTISAQNLPDGLRMDKRGWITGKPAKAENRMVKIIVKDKKGDVATKALILTVLETIELSITTDKLRDATLNQGYEFKVAATGGEGTYTFSAKGLPDLLTMNRGGLITGKPLEAGTFNVTIKVFDKAGNTGSKPLTLVVKEEVSKTITIKVYCIRMDTDPFETFNIEFENQERVVREYDKKHANRNDPYRFRFRCYNEAGIKTHAKLFVNNKQDTSGILDNDTSDVSVYKVFHNYHTGNYIDYRLTSEAGETMKIRLNIIN